MLADWTTVIVATIWLHAVQQVVCARACVYVRACMRASVCLRARVRVYVCVRVCVLTFTVA